MRKTAIFFLILLLPFRIPLVTSAPDEGYGEANENLGQFTDDFENADNVSVAINVINNQTLDCMELEYSDFEIYTDNVIQLREHDYYATDEPAMSFSIDSDEYLLTYGTQLPKGHGYNFLVVNSEWINGLYCRFRRMWQYQYGNELYIISFKVYDGTYDRTNDTHFQDDNPIITFGAGLLYNLQVTSNNLVWNITDVFMDIDEWGSTEDNVTIMFFHYDYYNAWTKSWIDWIEINENSGGADNIIKIDFEDTMNVVMEVTGTDGDYGYVNNTGLPVISGGFIEDGYFTTENYLNYTTGNSLTLLTNTSILGGTSITVEFSPDNSSWTLNDWDPIFGGFESIDLRVLNYSDFFMRYNFSGTPLLTPRLYQSRVVTTNGTSVGAPGPGVIIIESDAPWIALAIILSIIAFLLAWGSKR